MTPQVPAVDGPGLATAPVVLGGDIGAYSLARAFHDGYGVRTTVVSAVRSALVGHSRVLDHVAEPGLRDPDVTLRRLRHLADGRRASGDLQRPLLLASADRLVRFLVEHRDRLEDRYLVPYAPVDLLTRVTDKAEFARLCADVGVPHPDTVVVDVPDDPGDAAVAHAVERAIARIAFPAVVKAASTVAYESARFEGKRKVFVVRAPTELADLVRRAAASGWRGRFVVQDRIPGGDLGMRILSCYSDESGRLRYAAFGHVLLEEHAPTALGNPAAILTDHDEEVVEDARRLLAGIGWRGWSNFDLKLDPRTGRCVFFELNPRLGRSNHYVTAAGLNPVLPYVRETVHGLDPFPGGSDRHGRSGRLFTVLPRRLLERYVDDPQVRARIDGAYRHRLVYDPLRNPAERDPRRLAYVAAARANQFRKFARYHPLAEARAAAAVGAGTS
ncbi:MAG: carboxylate--amine ligase [Kineosporiaceae bacterium]